MSAMMAGFDKGKSRKMLVDGRERDKDQRDPHFLIPYVMHANLSCALTLIQIRTTSSYTALLRIAVSLFRFDQASLAHGSPSCLCSCSASTALSEQ